jgi:hypothetical protein
MAKQSKKKNADLSNTYALMGALTRMKPKQHEEMKLSRPKKRDKKRRSRKKG